MNKLRSLAGNHPIPFAFLSTLTWLVLLFLLSGIASSAVGRPFYDVIPSTIGRISLSGCILFLLWRLGWLKSSGVTRVGGWQVWLIALVGMIYSSAASLTSFFGTAAFDFSRLQGMPSPLAALITNFAAALSEEIAFRGLILHVLTRAWGSTRRELIGSVLLASFLFAVLHIIQVFANGVSLLSVLLLLLEALMVSTWWGALVLTGGSIWPAVMVHFVVNATVALQSLLVPMPDAGLTAYTRLLLFSLPLGALGIGMLLRASIPPAPGNGNL